MIRSTVYPMRLFSQERMLRDEAAYIWVTRVPASVKEAKELLFKDLEMKPCKDNRYSFFETQISYKGIDQKWVVIDSKEMHAKKAKTFDKNIEKEYKTAQISLNKLMRTAFACETDARITSEQWIKEHPHYRFKEFGLKTLLKRPAGCLGRPRKDEQLQPWYLIEATIEPDEEVIAKERSKLGRFVLASNDIEIDPEQLLQFYKGQGSVERDQVPEDKSFRVAEVYLKNEGRIELYHDHGSISPGLLNCRMDAEDATPGDWRNCPQPAEKAYAATYYEVDLLQIQRSRRG